MDQELDYLDRLRDTLALVAMLAVINKYEQTFAATARDAYGVADAMMAERAKRNA